MRNLSGSVRRGKLPQRMILWAIAFAGLGGCAGTSGRVVHREMLLPFTDAQREAIADAKSTPYKLRSGDVFNVQSLIDEELVQSDIIVLPDGTATFVNLGNVPVEGKTIGELQKMLNDDYSRDYRDVNLSVVLKHLAGNMVYVLGEVRNPGLFDVPTRGLGVMGAIARAGGFTDIASHGSVVLLRLTPEGYLCRELDVKALRKGGGFDAAALDLQPYDVIYVNRSKIGDFAVFSKNVAASLVHYSRFILDLRSVENPELFRR